jgi:putative hemolysin
MPNMANPASKNCVAKGGRLEIRSDAQGNESGVCVFPDGSSCDEWAFMDGKCQPGMRR